MVYNTRSKKHNEEIQAIDNDHRPTKKGKKNKQTTMDDEKKDKVSDKKKEVKVNDELNKGKKSPSKTEVKKEDEENTSPVKKVKENHPSKRGRKSKVDKEVKNDDQTDQTADNNDTVKKEENISNRNDIGNIPRSSKDEGVNLENGHIYFFYRPKMNGKESIQSNQDVQRLFMLLIPHHFNSAKDDPNKKRIPSLIIIGSKKLPLIRSHEKHWGFVSDASDDFHQLLKYFKEHTYSTKTRGKRVVQAVRILGIGAYTISHHQDKRNSYLSYILTDPEPLSSVQEEFNLKKEGTFAFSIKNPKIPYLPSDGDETGDTISEAIHSSSSSSSTKKSNKDPHFPDEIQKQFGDLRFLSMNETTFFLNYPNCQVLLVGTRDSIDVDEIGANAVEALHLTTAAIKQKSTAHVIEHDLKVNLSDYCIEPLKGQWA
ncbi:unnamed protein product [Cunninghamella blakesleeana]